MPAWKPSFALSRKFERLSVTSSFSGVQDRDLGRQGTTPENPLTNNYQTVMYLTGFFIISHSPVLRSYLQLQNASQLSLSMFGLSALK